MSPTRIPLVIAVRSLRLIFLVLLSAAACSHVRPFVRGSSVVPAPPLAAIDHRLILIGDAGDADPKGEHALELLEQRVRIAPARTTVVFLGDNVYETGMPEPTAIEGTKTEAVLDEVLLTLFASRRDAERRLKAQVKAVRAPGTRAIFIPGNHDWGQPGIDGWKRILAQQAYLDDVRQSVAADDVDVSMLPRDGCPGPTSVDLGRHGRLVVLDTEWWLDRGNKPSPEHPGSCPVVTEAGVQAALERELEAAAAASRRPIVVGHHPLASHGPHGDFVDPIVHVFPLTMAKAYLPAFVAWAPLPVIGSVMGWGRAHFSPSAQDFSGPGNAHFRAALIDAMASAGARGAPALAYAAGHDHSLQVFRSAAGPRWMLVSGLGSSSKASGVRHDGTTVFAHSDRTTPGFVELDFLTDGAVRLDVVEWSATAAAGVEMYSTSLTANR